MEHTFCGLTWVFFVTVQDPDDMFAAGAGSDKDFVTGHCFHDYAGFLLGNVLGFPFNDSYRRNNANTLNSTYQQFANLLAFAENVDELITVIEGEYPDIFHEDMVERTMAVTDCITDWRYAYKSHIMARDHVR